MGNEGIYQKFAWKFLDDKNYGALLKAVAGMPFEVLLKDNLTECVDKCRIISGNVLTGVKENIDGYLHFPFRQVTVIPENSHESEFMGWASLSPKKYSFSHCFFSWCSYSSCCCERGYCIQESVLAQVGS